MAEEHPGLRLNEPYEVCTIEDMRGAWQAGYDAATEYYAKGGSFK